MRVEWRSRNLEEEPGSTEPARKYINIRGCVPGWRRERERESVGLVERKGEVIRGVEHTLRVLAVCTASPASFGCFSGSQDSGPIARSADFFFFFRVPTCREISGRFFFSIDKTNFPRRYFSSLSFLPNSNGDGVIRSKLFLILDALFNDLSWSVPWSEKSKS